MMSASATTPSSSIGSTGAFETLRKTGKSGVRLTSRAGPSVLTTSANGASWLAYASRATCRTWAKSSENVGSPERSARNTTALTKVPTKDSLSRRFLLAMGAPMTMSSVPV